MGVFREVFEKNDREILGAICATRYMYIYLSKESHIYDRIYFWYAAAQPFFSISYIITRAKVGPVRCRHMASLGDNQLNSMVRSILAVHCLNGILTEVAVVVELGEYSHTSYRVMPYMCIICTMMNSWHFRDKLSKVTELPFAHLLHWLPGPHQGLCLFNYI